jgi:hypothetical protein
MTLRVDKSRGAKRPAYFGDSYFLRYKAPDDPTGAKPAEKQLSGKATEHNLAKSLSGLGSDVREAELLYTFLSAVPLGQTGGVYESGSVRENRITIHFARKGNKDGTCGGWIDQGMAKVNTKVPGNYILISQERYETVFLQERNPIMMPRPRIAAIIYEESTGKSSLTYVARSGLRSMIREETHWHPEPHTMRTAKLRP